MADEVTVITNPVTEEVTINVTNGGGMGTVTSVAIQGTDGIQVDSGSPIITNGIIVLGLSPTVLSQLSLAVSSLQPGANISELTNDVGFLEGVQAGSNISIDNTDPLNPVISATGMGMGTVTSVGITGTDGIEVDSGSPVTTSGNIQLGLSATVLGQLALAGSALQNITGLIEAGSNVTLDGAGTLLDPYVINSSGGISSVGFADITGSPSDNAALDAVLATIPPSGSGGYLPYDSTTAFTRTLLDDSDATGARITLGLGSIAVLNSVNLSTNVSGTLGLARGGTGAGNASDARTALGVAIGSNVQAYNAALDAISGGTWAGANSITTLGTITTGVWQGTAIADSYIASAATWNAKQPSSAELTAISAGTWTGASSITTIGTMSQINMATGGANIDAGGTGIKFRNGGGLSIGLNVGADTGPFLTAQFPEGFKLHSYYTDSPGLGFSTFFGSVDLWLLRDAAGVLGLRNGASPQAINIYGTYTSDTVFERIQVGHDGSKAYIDIQAGSGGGTVEDFEVRRGATAHLTVGTSGTTVNTSIALQKTITTAGTTGARTINTQTGTVNFSAGATSLVVTNSLVTTSSIILPVLRTNDASALIDSIVPASGSFTIYLSSAATAETSVGFVVL